MENRYIGILVIISVIFLYRKAFFNFNKNRYTSTLILIIISGLILRVFTSMDFYLHDWDERYHAMVAKNLLSNFSIPTLYKTPLLEYDYKNWAANHIWVHKQPVPIYTIALSFLTFGVNEIALRIPSIILNTLCIFLTYKISNQLFVSKKIGLIAAFLFSINGLLIELTSGRVATDHIDIFFSSLISLSVYFLLKFEQKKMSFNYLLLGGLMTGLAILTKWLPAIIVIPIWLVYGYSKHKYIDQIKNLSIFILIVLIVAVPWQLYIMHNYPVEASWEYHYNRLHIFKGIEPHNKPFIYHFDRMRIIFGELVYIPIVWLIVHFFRSSFNKSILILMVWIFVPYLFFSIVSTKMQGYIIFTSPAVFITIAIFVNEYLLKNRKNKFISIICVFLLLLPIRYCIERVKPFHNLDRHPEWIQEIKALNGDYRDSKNVIFNTKYPIQIMFYTDFVAYEIVPSNKVVNQMLEEGYLVHLDNNHDFDKTCFTNTGIKYVNISK